MVTDSEGSGRATDALLLQQAEALHRLHRHLSNARRRQTLGSKSKAAIHWTLRPLTRMVRAWQPTRTYGPAVARSTGVPLWRQFLQQWLVATRFNFSADTYYRYRLYHLADIGDAVLFFPLNVNMALRGHLYAHLDVDIKRLEDKRAFYRVADSHKLPVPTTVAEFANGTARPWREGDERVVLPPRDLFSKPADALEGKGVARWIWEDGRYRGEDGRTLTAQELLEHLAACSVTGPYILQERLTNHPAIAALGPKALCTARIVTVREANGSPEHLVSIFRMPSATPTAAADNFAAGGFASPIDFTSGMLGDAVRKDLRHAVVDCAEYPGSKRSFASFRLPQWNAALELCLEAHGVFSEFPSVGWDVAITPDGPILIEGNHDWDVVLAQQPGARPLGRTRFADSYRSFLEIKSAPR